PGSIFLAANNWMWRVPGLRANPFRRIKDRRIEKRQKRLDEAQARQKALLDSPIYAMIPTVRKYILTSLPKWWTHAIEARGDENLIEELALHAKGSSEPVKKALMRVSEHLNRRKLLGSGKFGGEIHFVVVDSSAFYHEKPLNETHTPQAAELARALNEIGNKHGVFVHYVTSDDINILRESSEHQKSFGPWGDRIQNFNPFWAVTPGLGRVFVGPGAAMNIALSYIRRLRERNNQRGEINYWRIDDDLIPTERQVSWLGRAKAYRNVFLDQQEIFKGVKARGRYSGWSDYKHRRLRPDEPLEGFYFKVYRGDPIKTPYYATTYSEDQRFQPRSGAFFEIVDYLVHVGVRNTYREKMKFVFGSYAFDSSRIAIPANERFYESVLQKSGANLRYLATETRKHE
ncbi:MAG: hypothetical protein V1817_02365, partial [Candidatus Micrarchaeota archaeon]